MKVPTASRDATSYGPGHPSRATVAPGITLLELTVAIMVLLTLVAILFIGAQAWKRGADRAMCIMQIQNMQKSVRMYSNLYGFIPGASAPGLRSKVIGQGSFVGSDPDCPGQGEYAFGQTYGEDTIPPMGYLYMECSLAGDQEHVPDVTPDW